MNTFVTTTDIVEKPKLIDEQNFSEATNKKEPYYHRDPDTGALKYYAICPLCKNPIQIINLYKKQEQGSKGTHGKHNKGTIDNLAEYDELRYLSCPYAKPNDRPSKFKVNPKENKESLVLITTMTKQFDRIIYILEQSLGVHFSKDRKREMLDYWYSNTAWRYYVATIDNLPFTLMYGSRSFYAVGNFIPKDSELVDVFKKLPNAKLENADSKDNCFVIGYKNKQFLDVIFFLNDYHIEYENDKLIEQFTFHVRHKDSRRDLYKKDVVVQKGWLQNMINKGDDYNRGILTLDIADKKYKEYCKPKSKN